MCYNENVFRIETLNDYGFEFAGAVNAITRSAYFMFLFGGTKIFIKYGGTRDESRYSKMV